MQHLVLVCSRHERLELHLFGKARFGVDSKVITRLFLSPEFLTLLDGFLSPLDEVFELSSLVVAVAGKADKSSSLNDVAEAILPTLLFIHRTAVGAH